MAADSGMGTCPSPEIADSRRKRPLDGDTENGDIKRSHFSSGGEATYHFKTLVPSVAVGAIIGKSGETILQLQNDTGAKVKMSKSHDFYPGTTERVCLISGSVDSIMLVMDFIMDKIREKPDPTKTFLSDTESKATQERDKQVKILVPNSTAGMIIGKAGNYIKQIKELTGSYVQISQKAKDISLQERCITVVGDKESNKKACFMILAKVMDDPASGSCTNVSYADVLGPVANYNPTGSPYAQGQQAHAFSSSTASLNNSALAVVGSAAGVVMNGTGLDTLKYSLNITTPQPSASTLTPQVLDHIKGHLRASGLNEANINEVCAALSILSKHGVLGLLLPPLASLSAVPEIPAISYFSSLPDQATTAGVYGAIGQVGLAQEGSWPPAAYYETVLGNTSPTTRNSLERYSAAAAAAATDVAFEPFRQPAVAPISINNNSFGLATGGGAGAGVAGGLLPISKSPTPGDLGAVDSTSIDIPEVIVGAILGPGGKNLVEIQKASGAVIQISKKGTFLPGTRNRIVTISGSTNAIHTARYYIQQRVTDEEMKRARQNTLPGIIQ